MSSFCAFSSYLFSTAFVTKDGSIIKCHLCKSNHFPNENDTNYVEPDIFVICGPGKLNDKRCTGPPDWVIEVIHSQSYNTFLPSKYK
ncbi:MAG: Uma2 family endonuclease [Lachnospiraceae bacterium]|nr:Uma2 family endonuclease [Lachnospiraceae bacterium]MCI9100068.1 Uma2 family endonuclease [Lachnospiraceae bacterium]MCI9357908.1 Uma2 family endonuclease [Lachnospiraceae bacterium]